MMQSAHPQHQKLIKSTGETEAHKQQKLFIIFPSETYYNAKQMRLSWYSKSSLKVLYLPIPETSLISNFHEFAFHTLYLVFTASPPSAFNFFPQLQLEWQISIGFDMQNRVWKNQGWLISSSTLCSTTHSVSWLFRGLNIGPLLSSHHNCSS